MDEITQKYASFLRWFFLFIVLETIFLISALNKEFFLFKILINYLFVLALTPFIFEKINKRKIDPFSPLTIFTFFYLLLFGMRAIDLLIFHQDLILEDEGYYIQALFYAIIGLHFFQIGYFSKLGQSFFRKKMIPDNWSITKFIVILISYSLISLLSFSIIIKLSGGFETYFHNIRNAMVMITSGTTIFFISVLLINIPLLIWFCYILENKKFSFTFILYFFIGALLLASLGERGHLIALIISMVICYNYLKKVVHLLPIFSLATVLILFLVIYGQYRDFTEQSYKFKKAGFNVRIGFLNTYHYFIGHFDQLRHVKDIIKYVPDDLNFQYGKTFLNLLVKPIPSAIWEGKPQGAGQIITKHIYPKAYSLNVTVAPSILGELYLNFYLLGVILGFLIFGVFCKALYVFLIRNYKNKNAIMVYSICLPYIFSELRGDFTIVTSFLIFNLIFLIIALNYLSIKRFTK